LANSKLRFASLALAVLAALTVLIYSWGTNSVYGAKPGRPPVVDLAGFSALAPIDAHTHVFKDDPAFAALLKRLNLRILNICVVDKHGRGYEEAAPQNQKARKIRHSTGSLAAWCSTFDPQDFEKPGFAEQTNKILNETFAEGAVAVKIWKSIGMELQKHDGSYLMPDDPAFSPIYADLAAHNRTLFAHIAEPTSCWLRLDPTNPDYSYYKEHPVWYMYLHPDHPSKETILAARDRMLASNPKLRVVGCHLGSMEVDVDEIARHFDRYPNFAVDTAARMLYLIKQPPEKVRAFLIKYQDRVVYGTDLKLDWGDVAAKTLPQWEEQYRSDWKYFATDEWVESNGKKYRGLKLPEPILHKLYHDNAVRWIPGIMGNP